MFGYLRSLLAPSWTLADSVAPPGFQNGTVPGEVLDAVARIAADPSAATRIGYGAYGDVMAVTDHLAVKLYRYSSTDQPILFDAIHEFFVAERLRAHQIPAPRMYASLLLPSTGMPSKGYGAGLLMERLRPVPNPDRKRHSQVIRWCKQQYPLMKQLGLLVSDSDPRNLHNVLYDARTTMPYFIDFGHWSTTTEVDVEKKATMAKIPVYDLRQQPFSRLTDLRTFTV